MDDVLECRKVWICRLSGFLSHINGTEILHS